MLETEININKVSRYEVYCFKYNVFQISTKRLNLRNPEIFIFKNSILVICLKSVSSMHQM